LTKFTPGDLLRDQLACANLDFLSFFPWKPVEDFL